MKYAIKLYTALCLIFVLLLSISGSISGIFGEVLYIAAFAAPAIYGLYLSQTLHKRREEEAGLSLENKWYYTLSGESVKLFLPLVMPVILSVMLISFLTALILSLFGLSNPPVELSSLPRMLVMNALLPAVLEELMFRYLPLKLILPYSKKACIIVSATYFALIHCNLFSIPYALLAGVLFISIDIAFDSVLPSLILHFMNNTLSIVMMKYCNSSISYAIYFGACGLLLFVSLPFIIRSRGKYKNILKSLTSGESGFNAGYYPWLLIIPTLIVAVLNLF